MYDIMRQAEEKLVQVGTDLTISVVVFIISIMVLTIIFNIALTIYYNRKPKEERKSLLSIFLISIVLGWALTTLLFVYRIVFLGIQHLKQ